MRDDRIINYALIRARAGNDSFERKYKDRHRDNKGTACSAAGCHQCRRNRIPKGLQHIEMYR